MCKVKCNYLVFSFKHYVKLIPLIIVLPYLKDDFILPPTVLTYKHGELSCPNNNMSALVDIRPLL